MKTDNTLDRVMLNLTPWSSLPSEANGRSSGEKISHLGALLLSSLRKC
jgi:hypothetical protein